MHESNIAELKARLLMDNGLMETQDNTLSEQQKGYYCPNHLCFIKKRSLLNKVVVLFDERRKNEASKFYFKKIMGIDPIKIEQ